MPTSQPTAILTATSALRGGHLAAVEHRPPQPVVRRPIQRRRVVLEVTREFYSPRVLILDPPMSN